MAKKTLHSSSESGVTPSTGADVVEAVNYLNEHASQVDQSIADLIDLANDKLEESTPIILTNIDDFNSLFALGEGNYVVGITGQPDNYPELLMSDDQVPVFIPRSYNVIRFGNSLNQSIMMSSSENLWMFSADGGASKFAKMSDLLAYLEYKAPLSSPEFTGIPKAPTQPTVDNSTRLATTAFVKNAIAEALANL